MPLQPRLSWSDMTAYDCKVGLCVEAPEFVPQCVLSGQLTAQAAGEERPNPWLVQAPEFMPKTSIQANPADAAQQFAFGPALPPAPFAGACTEGPPMEAVHAFVPPYGAPNDYMAAMAAAQGLWHPVDVSSFDPMYWEQPSMVPTPLAWDAADPSLAICGAPLASGLRGPLPQQLQHHAGPMAAAAAVPVVHPNWCSPEYAAMPQVAVPRLRHRANKEAAARLHAPPAEAKAQPRQAAREAEARAHQLAAEQALLTATKEMVLPPIKEAVAEELEMLCQKARSEPQAAPAKRKKHLKILPEAARANAEAEAHWEAIVWANRFAGRFSSKSKACFQGQPEGSEGHCAQTAAVSEEEKEEEAARGSGPRRGWLPWLLILLLCPYWAFRAGYTLGSMPSAAHGQAVGVAPLAPNVVALSGSAVALTAAR